MVWPKLEAIENSPKMKIRIDEIAVNKQMKDIIKIIVICFRCIKQINTKRLHSSSDH